MALKKVKGMISFAWIHSSRLHVLMYISLLVATPFVMLQVYMQAAVHELSVLKMELWGREIIVVPAVAAILFAGSLFFFRRYLTKIRLLGILIAISMIALAQQVADLYLNYRFYDIQQNWHYFAYALFAYVLYRDLGHRGVSWDKLIRYTYFIALSASTFDEAFQMHMSNRIFDISDIAKDAWGSLMGLVLVCFWVDRPFFLSPDKRRLRFPRLKDYYFQPQTLLVLLALMTFLLIFYSSLLTEFVYWKYIIFFTLCTTALILLFWHVSQFKWGRICIIGGFSLLILAQLASLVRYRDQNIVYNQPGITVYKGVVLPFFDMMIYPNGMFRLVDKKRFFNQTDRLFLLRQKSDIILIGSGPDGEGGEGFPKKDVSQFLYNPISKNGTQVIIMKNEDACDLFNRLKQEKKDVLFVLHNPL